METSVLAAAPLKRRPVSLACCTICPLVSKVSLGWIVTADGFEPEARFKPDACGEAEEKFVIIKNPQVS